MADTMLNQYVPDYLVTPGEVFEDYLEGFDMTQAELAARTGLTKKTVNEIIKGKSPITPETALKLERSLKIRIAPGIVVGRLQHEKRLPDSHGNELKVFYRWSD